MPKAEDEPEELNNEPKYYVEGKVFRGVKLQ